MIVSRCCGRLWSGTWVYLRLLLYSRHYTSFSDHVRVEKQTTTTQQLASLQVHCALPAGSSGEDEGLVIVVSDLYRSNEPHRVALHRIPRISCQSCNELVVGTTLDSYSSADQTHSVNPSNTATFSRPLLPHPHPSDAQGDHAPTLGKTTQREEVDTANMCSFANR